MKRIVAKIAQHWCETPVAELSGGRLLTQAEAFREAARKFPQAGHCDFVLAAEIADELLTADRIMQFEMDSANNPCACGAPGIVELVDPEHRPTGERKCHACAVASAPETQCIRCGGVMNGEDVLAGFPLCEACDPDEIAWEGEA